MRTVYRGSNAAFRKQVSERDHGVVRGVRARHRGPRPADRARTETRPTSPTARRSGVPPCERKKSAADRTAKARSQRRAREGDVCRECFGLAAARAVLAARGAPDASLCPQGVRESLDAFVNVGRPVGDFLRAVLENDLREAIGRADHVNIRMLPHIVAYVRNEVPSAMWGSRDAVAHHLLRKQVERESRRPEVSK